MSRASLREKRIAEKVDFFTRFAEILANSRPTVLCPSCEQYLIQEGEERCELCRIMEWKEEDK